MATNGVEDSARVDLLAAQAEWNRVLELERELRRDKKWRGEPVLDEPSWTLAVAELEEAKRDAAWALREAAERKHVLDVHQANLLLGTGAAKHDEAAARLSEELRQFEAAWCRLVVRGWALLEAAEVERVIAGSLIRAAKAAAPSDEIREAIQQDAAWHVPIAVDSDGPAEYRDRPEFAAFGGHGDAADPRRAAFYENIGRLILTGRRRAGIHVGRRVLDRLDEAARTHNNARGTR